jgi:hypothetical protein
LRYGPDLARLEQDAATVGNREGCNALIGASVRVRELLAEMQRPVGFAPAPAAARPSFLDQATVDPAARL